MGCLSVRPVVPSRFGTQTADVPGQQGDRVTVVGAPGAGRGRRAVLSAGPPGTRPGEPMALTNHLTGTSRVQGFGFGASSLDAMQDV